MSYSKIAYENKNWSCSSKNDLTLEDLENLIAASAKRLVTYRLENTSNDPSTMNSTPESDKWKQFINSDFTDTTTSNTEVRKSPSENYLKLRNMFESNRVSNIALRVRPKSPLDNVKSSKLVAFQNLQKTYNDNQALTNINNNQQASVLKLSTLASLKQRQNTVKKPNINDEMKSIEEYIDSVKKNSSSTVSKMCTSPGNSKKGNSTSTSKSKNLSSMTRGKKEKV